MVNVAGKVLGAEHARVLVADYALVSLQPLGEDGPTGDAQSIEGTLAGHAFARGEVVVSGSQPTLVWVPLSEGSERIGVLELSYDSWSDDVRAALAPVVRVYEGDWTVIDLRSGLLQRCVHNCSFELLPLLTSQLPLPAEVRVTRPDGSLPYMPILYAATCAIACRTAAGARVAL